MSKKITELNELIGLTSEDIILGVDNPDQQGSETKYIKISTLLDFLNGPDINPNKYDTTINLTDSNTKNSNGVNFTSNINNSISFNKMYLNGIANSMQVNINQLEQGLITFYSVYLGEAVTIIIDGIVYNTTFIDGIKNL